VCPQRHHGHASPSTATTTRPLQKTTDDDREGDIAVPDPTTPGKNPEPHDTPPPSSTTPAASSTPGAKSDAAASPSTKPAAATSTGGATPGPATDTRPGGSRWWLIPALTFLVGLVLGGVVVGAMRGGNAGSTAEVAPSTSAVPTPSASGTALPATATVVVPAECLQVAQDSQALVDLTSQAASAARDLDAGKLSDVVRQIDEAQTTLRTHAQACRAVDASLSSGATPSTTLAPTTTASPAATPPATATPTSAASS
jgi:hypothetical protein